jgi:hypothetical protein
MDGLEPRQQPQGYMVPDRKAVERILAIEAELLQSEGLDPTWPGFDGPRQSTRRISDTDVSSD